LRGAAPRLLATAFAVGVALSRSAVGAHWPSDLLAGAALGAAVAWSVDRGLARRHRATVPATAEPAAGSAAAAAAAVTAAPASSPSTPSTAAPCATTPTPGRRRAIAIGLLVGAVAIVLQPAAGATAAALQWVLAACGLVGAWRWWPRPPVTAGAPHPTRPPAGSATPARPATPTGSTREAAAATALTSAASAAATPCP
ncbi:MAG: superfamily, partial [Pseudomonadota bacterium]